MAILKARLTGSKASAGSKATAVHPFITLSREVCSGASTLGGMLIDRLDSEFGEEGEDWVLLDRDLLSYALAHHELPQKLARYLPEDKVSEIDSIIGEIVGLHPSIWALEQQVAESIVQLAHVGRIIFVGRAAHLLTRSVPGGLHVRLVASKEIRVSRYMQSTGCGEAEALNNVESTDLGRRRFVKSHFGRDIDDPHTYDLVINTDRISAETAATLVLEALRQQVAEAARVAQVHSGAPA